MIQKSINITSKGTFTLPATVRKDLGLKQGGDKLVLTYHKKSKIVEITKTPDLEQMQKEIAALIPKDIKPLTDVRKFLNEAKLDHIREKFKDSVNG